eukprot:gb/GECG01000109.1/.p1 GENE.gb/GECG01000109.1/~~gb/GECG01000109.1/.p1  ORF type:complete len:300 (+),score=17.74 gb/GECG01000109.1/:1-900(+)
MARIRPGFEAIYGAHSCLAALQYNSRSAFRRLYLSQQHETTARQAMQEIAQYKTTENGKNVDESWFRVPPRNTRNLKRLAEWRCSVAAQMAICRQVEVQFVPTSTLHSLADNRPSHNGIILEARSIQPSVQDFEKEGRHRIGEKINKGDSVTLLALDELQDVHNVGAIVRAAAFYEVDAIILSSKNMCPLNATVSKTSAGALETMVALKRLFTARKLTDTLYKNREMGLINIASCGSGNRGSEGHNHNVNVHSANGLRHPSFITSRNKLLLIVSYPRATSLIYSAFICLLSLSCRVMKP